MKIQGITGNIRWPRANLSDYRRADIENNKISLTVAKSDPWLRMGDLSRFHPYVKRMESQQFCP